MAEVVQTRTSLKDLDDIWDYVAESSPARASKLIRNIRNSLETLATMPYAGRPRDELGAGLRSHVIGDYVAVYHPSDEGIILVRVVHSRRDIGRLFD